MFSGVFVMMTAILVLALLGIPGQPFRLVAELPSSVKPSRVPPVVAGVPPSSVEVLEDYWVRGFHPIQWEYTIHAVPATVARALLKTFKYGPGGTYSRFLTDRVQGAAVLEGRRMEVSRSGSTWWELADQSEYATIDLWETPYSRGPMPAAWEPRAASLRPQVPVLSPKLPSLGRLEPAVVSSSVTPAGTIQVWIEWSVPFSDVEAKKRINRDIAKGAPWRLRGSRYEPMSRQSPWAYLNLRYGSELRPLGQNDTWVVEGSYIAPGLRWEASRYVKGSARQPVSRHMPSGA